MLGASITGAPVTVALVAVNVLVFLLLTATGGSEDDVNLYRWGAKYGPALADGEWWRLILPIFMHIGFFHLLTNSIGLLIFGSMAERFLGSPAYLAIYLITGILGNAASFVVTPALGAGASGAVFGVIGAFGIYLLLNRRVMGDVARQALTSIAFIVVLNIGIGFATAGIDNAAHVGGLLGGMFMAYLVSPRQRMVITAGWGELGPPRMGVSVRRQQVWLLVLAIGVGIAIAVVSTTIRSEDYPNGDFYTACGYSFADFSDPEGRFPSDCRSRTG
jgi:membrane associated rhomboid family serine protease